MLPARFLISLLTILCVSAPLLEAFSAEKPTVLLILVDDLKPALGCYGDETALTPNIDALAARGMRFDLAYCNQAVCAPSRFTLMLGSHSTSTGLCGLGSPLRKILPDAVTMPQHFAKHGYRTESLGKIFHIGHGNLGDPQSFSVPHFKEKVIEYVDPASKPDGKITREEAMFQNVPAPSGGMNSLARGAAFESPDVDDDAYADGRVAEETKKRLAAAKEHREKDGTPFFIAAGFARPHLPFSAPKEYWDLYDPDKLPMPGFEDLPKGSPQVAGKRGGEIRNYFPVPDKNDPAQISDEVKRQLIHGYYASTSYVDAQIGKVIDELDRLELADNTIVVLWGDHGFHLGDLGIWTKHTNYEQANRIPILITAPGVSRPGSVCTWPVESVDIYPTLAELAGLPAPTGPQPIDGLSLVGYLKYSHIDLMAHHGYEIRGHAFHAYPKAKMGRSIRTRRFRLVDWKKPGADSSTAEYELYDYEADPNETRNLKSNMLGEFEKLKAILATYPEAVSKPNSQGKTNGLTAESAALYDRQLPLPIDDWRSRWGQGDFPFGFMQLPGVRAQQVDWPPVREAMRLTRQCVSNAGMAVTYDLTDASLLHPPNKQDFAHRLALWARAEIYGQDIPASGPRPKRHRVDGSHLSVDFSHREDGLAARGIETVQGFELRAADGTWHTAKATIREHSVRISADGVKTPIAVRYAWSNHPKQANLVDSDDLPATPFQLGDANTAAKTTPSAAATSAAKKSNTPPPTDPPLTPVDISALSDGGEQLDIFLLMGQSNMKGRGVMPTKAASDPQIVMMHRKTDQWFIARHPLHLVGDPRTFEGHDNAGVGPGLAFAETIRRHRPATRVALVPCAVGGTRIALWQKGAKLYEDAVRRAKLALAAGPEGKTRIAGAIWLQGEADANVDRLPIYAEALAGMVNDLRNDLEVEDLAFLVTTIGEMRDDIDLRKKINLILVDLPNLVAHTAVADARDLTGHIGDQVHYDTATQNEIGRRFARVWLKMPAGRTQRK